MKKEQFKHNLKKVKRIETFNKETEPNYKKELTDLFETFALIYKTN